MQRERVASVFCAAMGLLDPLTGRSRADLVRIAGRLRRVASARVLAGRSPAHMARFLVQQRPPPLIDSERRVVLIWTPKVASSTAAIWFFTAAGSADEAEAFDPNPHRYRQIVHYGSELYRRGLADDLRDYRVLRIVRDPWTRSVSSYRHALWVGYHDEAVAERLGRPVNGRKGFSFNEYLDLLEGVGLENANLHDFVQRHRVEDVLAPSTIIRLPEDDLFESLAAFERDNGLPVTDLSSTGWIERVEGPRRAGTGGHPDDGPDAQLSRREAAKQGAWPGSQSLLTEQTRARISALYAVDVEAYFPDA